MKITIAHTIEEREEADAVLSALRPLLAWGKVRESDRHDPYLHIYLATKKPGKPRNSRENP
ncbi:hypothetical protein [uncultured Oscillibacter sp.]|uniref:hypothetical protein n=1 Tax=uncultured Oscillibacter sp. TaxID=876091 RepID=UPI00266EC6D4|nr:hypothetical protein [uncultured Oscillibacter sp.]